MLCGCMLKRGYSGDGCELASTLCKFDLKRGNLLQNLMLYVDVSIDLPLCL